MASKVLILPEGFNSADPRLEGSLDYASIKRQLSIVRPAMPGTAPRQYPVHMDNNGATVSKL